MYVLRIKNLLYSYDSRSSFTFPDIELKSGENLLILGESGIGKTTFLHLIAGLLSPNSGTIELMGTVLNRLSSRKLDQFRGRHIGLVFQRPHFINAISIEENLSLIQYLTKRRDDIRIQEVLIRLGIDHKAANRPYQLSQGEQQRAAIAMALVNHPQLILADEPTSSLDDRNCLKVVTLLKDQAKDAGSQLIIITHDKRLKTQFKNTLHL